MRMRPVSTSMARKVRERWRYGVGEGGAQQGGPVASVEGGMVRKEEEEEGGVGVGEEEEGADVRRVEAAVEEEGGGDSVVGRDGDGRGEGDDEVKAPIVRCDVDGS